MADLPYEISVVEVKQKMDAGEKIVLLDVRELQEYQIAKIDGAELIPMNTIPANLQKVESLADGALLVVHCHHGMRSLNVVNWLRQQGVANCQSMAGGIEMWSALVDSSVPRY